MIDVAEHDLKTVLGLLDKHVPKCEVRAFGSRVTWTAKDHSDLDLVVIGPSKLGLSRLEDLKEAFAESSLPFTVDLLDWNNISPEFQKNIGKSFAVIKKPSSHQKAGWQYYKVSEIAEVIGGGTPKTKVADYWNGDIPWITPKDLSDHRSRRIIRGERNITQEGLRNSSARLVPADTVLLTSRAPVGYLGLAQNELTTNQGFRNLVVKEGFSPEFVYYLLLNNVDYLKQHASGSTFQELSGGTLKNLEFQIPEYSTQNEIAKILGDLDEQIELNHQMNKTLESIAQALFKRWFVDFEHPDEHDKPYKSFGGAMVESDLGEFPKGWGISTVGETFNLTMGQSPPGETYNERAEGLPFFQGRADFGFRYPSLRVYCTEPTRFAKAGDTLVSVRAPVGDINMAFQKCAIGRGVASVRHKTGSRSFTYYFMRSIKSIFDSFEAEGTVFGSIGKDGFRSIQAIQPLSQIIQKFENKIHPIDQMIENNERETLALISVRDSLLPKLMSGKISVGA